jgi:non-ribosomal peptide synthase protein (TIGR01720 family)
MIAAYRGRRRWLRSFELVSLDEAPQVPSLIRERGTYLIFGASSRVGSQIAEWLALAAHARLVLADELWLPQQDRWHDWIESAPQDDPVVIFLRRCAQWEAAGAEILLGNGDFSETAKIRALLANAAAKFGSIHGVFVIGQQNEELLAAKQIPETSKLLAGQIQGDGVLDEVLGQRELDFEIFCSPLSRSAGKAGVSRGASAVLFDGIARQKRSATGRLVLSVAWDTRDDQEAGKQGLNISPVEAVEALRRLLHAQCGSEVVVSARDPEAVIPANEAAPASRPSEHAYVPEDAGRPVVPASNEVESALVRIWGEVLGVSLLGTTDNFFEMGGDSLIALKMTARAKELGCEFGVEQLFKHPTIQLLAAEVLKARSAAARDNSEMEVLPEQKQILESGALTTRSALISLLHPTDVESMRKVVEDMVAAHDGLRLRFSRSESGYKLRLADPQECRPFADVDSGHREGSEESRMIESIFQEDRFRLRAEQGDVFQAVAFHADNKIHTLFLQALELAADGASLSLLENEIENRCGTSRQSATSNSSIYGIWRSALEEYGRSMPTQFERNGHDSSTLGRPGLLPVDFSRASGREQTMRSLSVSLSAAESFPLLVELPKRFRCHLKTVLLTGFVQALSRWSGMTRVFLETTFDGRTLGPSSQHKLAQAIGCYSTMFPALLRIERSAKGAYALKTIKEQIAHASQRAIACKWLGSDLEPEIEGRTPEVRFECDVREHQRQSGNLLLVERDHWTQPRSLGANLLQVIATITEDRSLFLSWRYSSAHYREQSIQRLAESYLACLRSLNDACQRDLAPTYTPSDFPEAQLSQRDLDSLLAEIGTDGR